MRIAVLLCAGTVLVMAQNPLAGPDPFVGTFQGDGVTLEMARSGADYAGTLSFQGRTFRAAMKASDTVGSGSFEVNGQDFPFILKQDGTGFKLASAGTQYRLARKAPGAPSGEPAPAAPAAPKDEAGEGSIHMELAGKWCWISVTTANQGAGQSSRCITLNGNGTYTYAGATDSYNPFGGTGSQAADSGTWTATQSTLTTHSRSGKTTTYRLEKRNHPKNVRDPMIVLDGQTFVTAYNKVPW